MYKRRNLDIMTSNNHKYGSMETSSFSNNNTDVMVSLKHASTPWKQVKKSSN